MINPNTSSAAASWQRYHQRQCQVLFSGWASTGTDLPRALDFLSDKEKEVAQFHLNYNPSLACLYSLPSYDWAAGPSSDVRYVGDRAMILAFSYVSQTEPQPDHTSSSRTPKPLYFANHASTRPPLIKIHWLRVTMDWVVAGHQPNMVPSQIYPDRYQRLYHILARRYGCFKYDELAEPVLAYIVDQDDQKPIKATPCRSPPTPPPEDETTLLIPPSLLSYVQAHTHEYHTRLSKLGHMLAAMGVDARMIWKYPFARSFVVGNGSLLGEEDVVHRIQDAEIEWAAIQLRCKQRQHCQGKSATLAP
ncbi:hypothetical protein DM01DRAFT_1281633 [Hesseltinella vesiculosa]|uniref:Uncharacterized protein n=1 Tax=Hesseltinella vesiculosa TaxID=101127 RepID=A0A1X2GSE9_9FUNG|nr:hypothetical protein DM01DRAFT_1281633 [Hesseltinella vesiculosa]